jgi:hypothetical protein
VLPVVLGERAIEFAALSQAAAGDPLGQERDSNLDRVVAPGCLHRFAHENSSSSTVPANASQAGSCIRLMMITLSTSLPGPGELLAQGGQGRAGPGREMTGHRPGSAPAGIAACRAAAEPRSPGRYRWM